MACPSTKVSYFLFAFCAMPQPSQMRPGPRDFLVLCNNSSGIFWDLLGSFGIFWVCSLECLLSATVPESQDSVLGPFSKIMGCAKAVLGVHVLQLSSRSDQNHRSRLTRQTLIAMLNLKLCNSNCWDSRRTKKLIRSLKTLKTCKVSLRRAVWKVVWMEGPLHSQILRWELSACFCLLSWLLLMAKFDWDDDTEILGPTDTCSFDRHSSWLMYYNIIGPGINRILSSCCFQSKFASEVWTRTERLFLSIA